MANFAVRFAQVTDRVMKMHEEIRNGHPVVQESHLPKVQVLIAKLARLESKFAASREWDEDVLSNIEKAADQWEKIKHKALKPSGLAKYAYEKRQRKSK